MTDRTVIVPFEQEMRAIGRNGLYKQAGITVDPGYIGLGGGTFVEIRGLTSRNQQATGVLAVPIDRINAFIDALRHVKDEMEN